MPRKTSLRNTRVSGDTSHTKSGAQSPAHEPGMRSTEHAWNPSTWGGGCRGLEDQNHPQLYMSWRPILAT